MSRDIILERYNQTIIDSIKLTLESERIIRVNGYNRQTILSEQESAVDALETMSKEKRLQRIATTAATSAAKGAAKSAARNAASRAFAAKFGPHVKKALQAMGFKSIPVLGSVLALLSLAFNTVQFVRSMSSFTDKLLEYSGVQLSGVRSFLGEYSIIDASAEDMKKVAESLEENLTEEQREELRLLYFDTMEEFKDILVDILLAIKDFTAEVALGAAIAVKLTPGERIVKNILFKAHDTINSAMSAAPEWIQKLLKVLRAMQSVMPGALVPILGFIMDANRIEAFIEIDKIIDTPRDSMDHLEDVVGYTARKAGGLRQDMGDFTDDIGQSLQSMRF